MNVRNHQMDSNMPYVWITNMSAAALVHRSGGSSSASSIGTGSSSAGGGPGNGSTGGSPMAVIGVTRNVRLRRRGTSGFGFSLRGGREHAVGFYVSDVQPGGEAHRNGLRVGDQIIRVNGYPVEDAVHQEVALLVKNQQILVLKIRSVNMIPLKDNPNDPVTWHMVQSQQPPQQQQQLLPYNETGGSTIPYNEVRIRVMVGEKGKLGCGVCKGIVPGLTVQGTRDGGPARAAGLKAGDVIIWCNGQRLTDLPFERAIEVMRSAAILDLIVNRPLPPNSNSLYDCPETLWMRGSSGYDSETSSIITPSPTPTNITTTNSSSPQHHGNGMQSRYVREDACGNRNKRACCPLALSTSSCSSSEWSQSSDQSPEWARRPNNTTVIRVNQNINQNHANQSNYRQNVVGGATTSHPVCQGNYGLHSDTGNEPLYDPVEPKDYESHDFDADPHDEHNRRLMYDKHNVEIYNQSNDERNNYNSNENDFSNNANVLQRHSDTEKKTVTRVEVHQSSPPAPPCPPPMSYKWQTDAKQMMTMGKQMGSTMSMGSTGSTETESSLESCGKDSASTSSTISTSSCEPASTVASGSSATATNVPPVKLPEATTNIASCNRIPPPPPVRLGPPMPNTDLGTAITQELQRRAQQRSLNAGKVELNREKLFTDPKKSQSPEILRAQENKVTHDKLMEEFKRAHRKMFNGNQQKVQFTDQTPDKEQDKQEKRVMNESGGVGGPPPPPMPVASPEKNHEDTVEMQSIESFKLKESPSPVIPKPPPTYFSPSSSLSPSSSTLSNGSPKHSSVSLIKTQVNGNPKEPQNSVSQSIMGKKSVSKINNGSVTTTAGGKVAVKIGSYEGDVKQPSRLDFLPQQSRTVVDSAKSINDEISAGPVVSRLQNELVATLQRSNLKKKTDEDNAAPGKVSSNSESNTRPVSLLQSNVEKLAAAISNRVTIKVSPENGSR